MTTDDNTPYPRKAQPSAPTQAQIDERLARVDGINGAAGLQLEDPYLRDLLAQLTAGSITADEYDRRGMAHLRGKSAG